MRKLYRKLTKEQIKRGVVFSSCLSVDKVEHDTIHEVFNFNEESLIKIERLKDDKFFNSSHFKFNIIRCLK